MSSYYERNKDVLNAKAKIKYQQNKEYIRAKQKEYKTKSGDTLRSSLYVKQLDHYYKNKYGITYEEYLAISAKQQHLCAICNLPESCVDPRLHKVKRLAVDHCHDTGKVRGLLCHQCNRALGGFRDNISRLESAINYLKGN